MAKFTFWQFIQSQRLPTPPLIKADLSGQTVLVIGANAGLGLAAAKQYAQLGPARLILACRSRARGEAAVEELKRETGYENAELRLVDLGHFSSVSAFADELEKEGGRIDVVLANAAVAGGVYEATQDGWESQLQVNHLSTALLCLRLLPRMVQTARQYNTTPRLTIVSSEMHFTTTVPKDVLDKPNFIVLNVLFTRALTNHLPPASPIVVNTANPGFCYSSLRSNLPFVVRLLTQLMELALARETKTGSSILVWASLAGTSGEVSPDLRDKQRGAYVSDWKVSEPSDFVLSDEGKAIGERLWEETLQILIEQDPKIKNIAEEFLQ